VVTDLAGNVSATFITKVITVDNQPPTVTFLDFQESQRVGPRSTGATSGVGDNVGCTSTRPAPVAARVRFTATDPGTGMQRLDYPAIGAGWSPAGGSVPSASGRAFSLRVRLQCRTVVGAGLQTVLAYDQAGNFAPADFVLELDSTPARGRLDHAAGRCRRRAPASVDDRVRVSRVDAQSRARRPR
jgi:hypothetical protein